MTDLDVKESPRGDSEQASPRTGPEHYQCAAVFADVAMAYFRNGNLDRADTLAAIAQVHADLAVAAATALNPGSYDAGNPDHQEWKQVAGSRPRSGRR